MVDSQTVAQLDLGSAPEPSLQDKVDAAKAQVDASARPAEAKPEPAPEAFKSNRLAMVIRKYRVVTEIEPQDMAKQIGITTRQLTAFEQGKECGSQVLGAVLAWILGAA